jgi:hypothetical protein
MDVWSVSLMFGATALWATMLVAVAVRIRCAPSGDRERDERNGN